MVLASVHVAITKNSAIVSAYNLISHCSENLRGGNPHPPVLLPEKAVLAEEMFMMSIHTDLLQS